MIIDKGLLDKVSEQAKDSPRLRMRSVYRFACKELQFPSESWWEVPSISKRCGAWHGSSDTSSSHEGRDVCDSAREGEGDDA